MLPFLDGIRVFSFWSVVLRLLLAMLAGGILGYGRSKQARNAGFRTYMIISVGAAMAVVVTLYQYEMIQTAWAEDVARIGVKFDASRLASQVLTGIGFLGAGIIIKAAHQQVNGLTTATGLFANVCMGIAAGAGFYELVLISLLLIAVVLNVMSPLEILYKRRLRNITLNVEFNQVEDIGKIVHVVEERGSKIYDIDVERTERSGDKYPSAIIILQMSKHNHSHSDMLSSVAELSCVHSVQELVS